MPYDFYINRRDWPDEDWQVVWFMPTEAGGLIRAEKEFESYEEAAEWACASLGGVEVVA